MKIALVRRGYSATGGAEAYLLRLADALARKGCEPLLITTEDWPAARWSYGEIVRVAGASPARFARALDGLDRRWDVLFSLERVGHCDVYRAGDGVHAAWLQRRAMFEPRWRTLARALNSKHRQLLALERCVFDPDRTRLVIANSQLVRDEIAGAYGFPPDRIRLVRNGVGPIEADAGAGRRVREHLSIRDNEIAILFAGSGWDRKGLRFAIDATARIPNARLIVAGKGNRGRLERKHVTFLGPVKNMPELFAAADIFVLPTLYDPFSNACLEAFSAGVPVITTIANGFHELIEPGSTGECVDPGDVDMLASALGKWGDRERCRSASERCHAVAAAHSIEANAVRTLEVIFQAMKS